MSVEVLSFKRTYLHINVVFNIFQTTVIDIKQVIGEFKSKSEKERVGWENMCH
jgi:tRNA (Thr-GGU) A37 N-methylase